MYLPNVPIQPKDIVVHSMEYAGMAFEDKINDLRTELSEKNYEAMIVTELDEIAWLFNLRGEGETTSTV